MVAIVMSWIVALRFQGAHLLGREPEQEKVFGADRIADLYVCAVERADSQGAVHREFHVAGSGCFCAGKRNLLGKIGRRINALPEGYIVIGEEEHAQASTNVP